jgi:hypothetical protein
MSMDDEGAQLQFPELDGVIRLKREEFAKLQVVGAPPHPLGPVCTTRQPVVGDRVMSTRGDAHAGDFRDGDAWSLNAGDVATVEMVSADGLEFKLKGGHGQKGNQHWAKVCYFSYADAG